MSDMIDVLDNDGIRTGEILERSEIHKQGKPHRAVHLYLFDINNKLLMQKRSRLVDHFPGKLSISVTGHVQAGESSHETLNREIKEELGLDASKLKTEFLFSFRQVTQISSTYIDDQFNDVYASWGKFNLTDIKMQEEEVSSVELLPFEEFFRMVKEGDDMLPPVYQRGCNDVIYFLQKRLNSNLKTAI